MRSFRLHSALAGAIGFAIAAASLPARAHDEGPAAKAEAKKHAGAPSSFKTKPAAGTWATCPVSGETFQIDSDTRFESYKGRVYAFCCPDCPNEFKEHPEKFTASPKSKS